jgi:Fe-S-cluster containining protein
MLRDTHESIVDDWMTKAQAHDDDNYQFLRSLKWHPSSKKVDRVAKQLHEQVFQIIDCTRCANCCRTLRPDLTDADIDRIALHLGQPREEFINTFLIWDDEDRCYRTKTAPCPLLSVDGRCTVYDVRPETCRDYPHTHKKDFVFNTMSRADAALSCPAAFAIIEGMKRLLDRRKR